MERDGRAHGRHLRVGRDEEPAVLDHVVARESLVEVRIAVRPERRVETRGAGGAAAGAGAGAACGAACCWTGGDTPSSAAGPARRAAPRVGEQAVGRRRPVALPPAAAGRPARARVARQRVAVDMPQRAAVRRLAAAQVARRAAVDRPAPPAARRKRVGPPAARRTRVAPPAEPPLAAGTLAGRLAAAPARVARRSAARWRCPPDPLLRPRERGRRRRRGRSRRPPSRSRRPCARRLGSATSRAPSGVIARGRGGGEVDVRRGALDGVQRPHGLRDGLGHGHEAWRHRRSDCRAPSARARVSRAVLACVTEISHTPLHSGFIRQRLHRRGGPACRRRPALRPPRLEAAPRRHHPCGRRRPPRCDRPRPGAEPEGMPGFARLDDGDDLVLEREEGPPGSARGRGFAARSPRSARSSRFPSLRPTARALRSRRLRLALARRAARPARSPPRSRAGAQGERRSVERAG